MMFSLLILDISKNVECFIMHCSMLGVAKLISLRENLCARVDPGSSFYSVTHLGLHMYNLFFSFFQNILSK